MPIEMQEGGRTRGKMENPKYLSFFLLSLLLCIAPLITDAKQIDALTKLRKAKIASGPAADNLPFQSNIFEPNDIIIPQLGSKKSDKIVKLPGQSGNIDFAHYGGYVTVDKEAGRALFYYFAEATRSRHAARPLVLWLNGGPGCSSFIGAMEELGPFRVMSDGKTLFRNKFSWNRVANVLFLESPAGVGFSYSNRTTDYDLSGDKRTAEDAYVFLVNWLDRFPEYKTRDFYIAGESYAGHYVPQLAHTILQHNKLPNSNYINLKGILIGNAVIHDPTDDLGLYDFFWTHALISDETISNVHKYCDFSADTVSYECNDALRLAEEPFDSLDIYNIYAPLCHSSNLTVKPKKASIMRYDPCTDYYVDAYLNAPEVQEALHANVTKVNYPWTVCSEILPTWKDSPQTIIPLLREFMANGIRVWVFSGDIDGRVPVTSTRYSLSALKLPVKSAWRPWFLNREVGGYTEVYKGDITLVTVRGAGHEVPSYQPIRALTLFHYFLLGRPLPS